MVIREALREDAAEITRLTYETIHAVNIRDYSEDQVAAWASASLDVTYWAAKQETRQTFVAEQAGQIVGYAEFVSDGHIDCFYCHKDFQGQGVGTALLARIVVEAQKSGVSRLFTEASITACPFFERRGFNVVMPQEVRHNGQTFLNYRMERLL